MFLLLICRYHLIFSFILIGQGRSEEVSNIIANKLSDFLHNLFAEASRFDSLEQTFTSFVRDSVDFNRADPDIMIDNVERDIASYLAVKVKALKKLVDVAERTSENFDYNYSQMLNEGDTYAYGDLREWWDNNTNPSGVHVPLDVYIGDKHVIRDIEWTNSSEVIDQFRDNSKDSDILRQYISTHAGITRIFPPTKWVLEPALMTVDLFDPRYRTWFTSSTTCPKDVLFVLDYSGSVLGQTSRLMKLTVQTIMASLTADDYVNAIWFNKAAGLVLNECFGGFVQATTRNKILLHNKLGQYEEHLEANFTLALDFAYSSFQNLSNLTELLQDLNYGSGCHKMLVFLTDSTEDHTDQIFNKLKFTNEDGTMNVSIRFFGIAMGFGTRDIKLLQELSCMDKGFYTRIDSFEDIKLQSRMFFPVLSRPLVLALTNQTVDSRPVTWTGLYMDAQGKGPILTMSMPIINRMQNGSNQEFAGVAAIDMRISELSRFMRPTDLDIDAYYFISDRNGNIMFHPRRFYPEIDLQMIRRTACFDASANKSGDATVLFTDVNEQVYAQMGYFETIPTLDMLDIEQTNEQTEKLRQIMVTKKCSSEVRIVNDNAIIFLSQNYAETKKVVYTCRHIRDTSLSVALAIPQKVEGFSIRVKEEFDVSSISISDHSLVQWFVSPRVYCGFDYGSVNFMKRSNKFNIDSFNQTNCMSYDETTKRLFIDFQALSTWNSQIQEISPNFTCEENFMHEMYRLIFIQTDGGLTLTYPRCSKQFPDFLKVDTRNSDQFAISKQFPDLLSVTQSSEPDFVNLMRTISLENYPLAMMGVMIHWFHLYDFWKNLTIPNDCWDQDQNAGSKTCYIVNNRLNVLASNTRLKNAHLSLLDGKLFEHFVNHSLLSQIEYKDYQAKCRTDEGAHSVSDASTISGTIVKWLFQLVGSFTWLLDSTFWLHLWTSLSSVFVSVDARLPNCHYTVPKKELNCILQRFFYMIDMDRLPISDEMEEPCTRRFDLIPIRKTNLILIVADKPCISKGWTTNFSQQMNKISECQEIKIRYRNRPNDICVPFHTMENATKCSSGNSVRSVTLSWLFIYLFIKIVLFS